MSDTNTTLSTEGNHSPSEGIHSSSEVESNHDRQTTHPHSLKEAASTEHTSNKSLAIDKQQATKKRNAIREEARDTPSTNPTSPEVFASEASGPADGTSIIAEDGDSDRNSDISMEERSIDKLRRHHRYNRAVVVSTDNVSAILDTIGMKDDSIYGSRVVESLGCIILFFKNAKLLTSAVTAASRAKIPMFAQTTKTAYKYQIGKDLNASNISKLVKKLGPTIVTLNVSNRNGSEYWAMGTSAKISTADSKSFKLSKVNTDETIFRIAFPGKEKDLYKLVSAVSTQWKVRVVKATLNNKVAYLSINKKEITNNVTETIKVKNQAFKNLSFSAKVAKSIAHRMANVETKISELTTTMSMINKTVARFKIKDILDIVTVRDVEDRINMSNTGLSFKLATANFAGTGWVKQSQMLSFIEDQSIHVLNVQETHLPSSALSEHYWQNKHFRSFFYPSLVFTSNAPETDKGAGVATIVKPSPLTKVLTFIEHVVGRITELILEHKQLGVLRIFNWYGPANDYNINRQQFMINTINILTPIIQSSVLHNERVIILGDLNATTTTYTKTYHGPHEKQLAEFCNSLRLFDIAPAINRPSHQQRNKQSQGFSRPDHIISTHADHVDCEDIDTPHAHKLLTISYTLANNFDFPEKFNKVSIPATVLSRDSKAINATFLTKSPKTLKEVQKVLQDITVQYGKVVNDKPKLITNNKRIIQLQKYIFEIKQLSRHKRVSNITAQFLEGNFSSNNVELKLKLAKQELNSLIGTLLANRKKVFMERVNNLSSKYPYSYAFRKELSCSSILGIVKHNHNKTISKHFEDMSNTTQKVTKALPDINKNRKLKSWRLTHISVKDLGKTIKKTKNSMAGYDNISVPLIKVFLKRKPTINKLMDIKLTLQLLPILR
ncbi:predicted protein [Naegleria gruberi]|uniref:Predicted protein n=1 Tax=Naegleria gruberi TaxID=5762 RepID=D2W1Y1_NAEGR|nr:uncharacterized protein NAEGRDRAFT_75389 [Naegleria gruberi]EFC36846.1 predicted protein [Naegleria gruberi]|eukprot:XP_002669590.1 predicted protein [Naegleria gruberi strain NEG-M]